MTILTALLMAACAEATSPTVIRGSDGKGVAAHLAPPAPSVVDADAVRATIATGNPTVILFMAAGCTSCAAQATALASAAAGQHAVRLVGVDVASADRASDLQRFLMDAHLDTLPITWTIDTDGGLAQQYGVQALDQTVGLANGGVRFVNSAEVDASTLSGQIAALR